LMDFKMSSKIRWGCFIPEIEGRKKFYKKALVVICSRAEQLTRATTLPWYVKGLSLKFVSFSAGSLTLYKGLRGAINAAWYPLLSCKFALCGII
jgi:hypothetical protein